MGKIKKIIECARLVYCVYCSFVEGVEVNADWTKFESANLAKQLNLFLFSLFLPKGQKLSANLVCRSGNLSLLVGRLFLQKRQK